MTAAARSGRRKAYPRFRPGQDAVADEAQGAADRAQDAVVGGAQDDVADRATLVSPILVAMARAVAESGPGCGTKTASR